MMIKEFQKSYTKPKTKGGENIMKKIIMLMIMLAFVFAMNVQSVQALPILTLYDGVTTVTVNDLDLDGVVSFNGSIGSWTVNVTTGITMPAIGSSLVPVMDLNSINLTGLGPGTLTITFSEDGFSLTNGTLQAAVGGTTGGTASFATLLNGTSLSSLALGPFSPIAFSGTAYYNNLTLLPTDILAQQAVIIHTGAGQVTSFDKHLDTVPEPATLILLGTGFASLAFFARRKRN